MAHHWYSGPWIWQENLLPASWRPPVGMGGLDLRTLDEMSQRGGTPGRGLFYGPVAHVDLESRRDYTYLGEGSFLDIQPTTKQRAAIPCRTGYSPQGDTLQEIIFDILTHGADVDGLDGPKPIMPTVAGEMELHMGRWRFNERLVWGIRYYDRVRQSLRRQFAELWARNMTVARKNLGYWVRQYTPLGLQSWQDLVPPVLVPDVEGPLDPETTLSETFNTADSSTLGPTYSWTEYSAGAGADRWSVVSNQARISSHLTEEGYARADSDLSSADHYAQVNCVSIGAASENVQIGAACRFSSSASTGYIARAVRAGLNDLRLEKNVTGTLTGIAGPTGISLTTPFTVKSQANGSTIKAFHAGSEILSVTDTSITTGTRGGIFGFYSSGTVGELDDWTAADLAVAVQQHLMLLGVG